MKKCELFQVKMAHTEKWGYSWWPCQLRLCKVRRSNVQQCKTTHQQGIEPHQHGRLNKRTDHHADRQLVPGPLGPPGRPESGNTGSARVWKWSLSSVLFLHRWHHKDRLLGFWIIIIKNLILDSLQFMSYLRFLLLIPPYHIVNYFLRFKPLLSPYTELCTQCAVHTTR